MVSRFKLVAVLFSASVFVGCAAENPSLCGQSAGCEDHELCLSFNNKLACYTTCSALSQCGDSAPICDEHIGICRACLPGEDDVCRRRDGNTRGCVGGRCVRCRPADKAMESLDCGGMGDGQNLTSVCDTQSMNCRPCRLHSECASGVCSIDDADPLRFPRGACIPKANVLVVNENLCFGEKNIFCTLEEAANKLDAAHPYIRLIAAFGWKGMDRIKLGVERFVPTIRIIGELADTPAYAVTQFPRARIGTNPMDSFQDGLIVEGTTVFLDGVYVNHGLQGVFCQQSEKVPGKKLPAKLFIRRSYFSNNYHAIVLGTGCHMTLTDSWFGRGTRDTPLEDERRNHLSIRLAGGTMSVSNTVFSGNGTMQQYTGGIMVSEPIPDLPRSTIFNSVFYAQDSGAAIESDPRTAAVAIHCEPRRNTEIGDRLIVANSVFHQGRALIKSPYKEVFFDPKCKVLLRNNATNDPDVTEGGTVVLPEHSYPFRNAPARDYRLAPLEPDAAPLLRGGVPFVEVGGERYSAPKFDYDGRPRPSESVSIGAFEP